MLAGATRQPAVDLACKVPKVQTDPALSCYPVWGRCLSRARIRCPTIPQYRTPEHVPQSIVAHLMVTKLAH